MKFVEVDIEKRMRFRLRGDGVSGVYGVAQVTVKRSPCRGGYEREVLLNLREDPNYRGEEELKALGLGEQK